MVFKPVKKGAQEGGRKGANVVEIQAEAADGLDEGGETECDCRVYCD